MSTRGVTTEGERVEPDWDHLPIGAQLSGLRHLDAAALRRLREHEARGAARPPVLLAIDAHLTRLSVLPVSA